MRDPIMRLERFTFNKESKMLVADASELPGFQSCIRIAGVRREISFRLFHTYYDDDGDVTHWEFSSYSVPITVQIFND